MDLIETTSALYIHTSKASKSAWHTTLQALASQLEEGSHALLQAGMLTHEAVRATLGGDMGDWASCPAAAQRAARMAQLIVGSVRVRKGESAAGDLFTAHHLVPMLSYSSALL